jgi:hypothetical protein
MSVADTERARDDAALERRVDLHAERRAAQRSLERVAHPGAQARPSFVPRIRQSSRPAKKRGTSLLMLCASNSTAFPNRRAHVLQDLADAPWYGRHTVWSRSSILRRGRLLSLRVQPLAAEGGRRHDGRLVAPGVERAAFAGRLRSATARPNRA